MKCLSLKRCSVLMSFHESFHERAINVLKNKKLFLALAVIILGLIACVGFVFANAQEGEDFEYRKRSVEHGHCMTSKAMS